MPKGPVTYYQLAIAKIVPADIDPRHVEGFMRLKYDALSELSRRAFNREVAIGVACIREGGVEQAERNAQSFGL